MWLGASRAILLVGVAGSAMLVALACGNTQKPGVLDTSTDASSSSSSGGQDAKAGDAGVCLASDFDFDMPVGFGGGDPQAAKMNGIIAIPSQYIPKPDAGDGGVDPNDGSVDDSGDAAFAALDAGSGDGGVFKDPILGHTELVVKEGGGFKSFDFDVRTHHSDGIHYQFTDLSNSGVGTQYGLYMELKLPNDAGVISGGTGENPSPKLDPETLVLFIPHGGCGRLDIALK
jgi:hypothetical protein